MTNKYFTLRCECPACSSKIFRIRYQIPFDKNPIRSHLFSNYSAVGNGIDLAYLAGANYQLCECKECELIFQKEIPNEKLMTIIYEKWIDPTITFQNHQKNDDLLMYSNYVQEISTIIHHIGKISSELLFFDFGMGWGKWSLMAKGFGCKSYGTELSKERIKYAESNGIKVITWDEIPEHRFDFINAEQVFEHISSPLNTLCHLKNALKDNGILKISVPTANNINRRLSLMDWEAPRGTRNSLNPVAPLEHINFFRRKSLLRMAGLAGLKEVLIPMKTNYMYTFNWNGMKRTVRNILLPIYRNVLKKENCLFFQKNH
jgi:2-polyprenyl-3-methyl-5-hydroxy-6-metoxy-1,4-benzoquinol methylase